MLVLDDARPGRLCVGIVDDRIALKIGYVQNLVLETQRAVFERAEAAAVILVYAASEHDAVGRPLPAGAVGKKVGVCLYLYAVQRLSNSTL